MQAMPLLSKSGRSTIRRLPKSRSTARKIYVPCASYREELAWCKEELQEILDTQKHSCADHAFVRGRNCVTNAEAHLGRSYVLSLDVEEFFDSIRSCVLTELLSPDLLFWVLEDGAPRQGLPTSPLVANIAMLDADRRIRHLCDALGGVTYTRYADDLTFGFDDLSLRSLVQQGVEMILKSMGLVLNRRKTRLQCAKNGNIQITGVAIDDFYVRPTRSIRRRLRAATHQGNRAQAVGLEEWAKCKRPQIKKHASLADRNMTKKVLLSRSAHLPKRLAPIVRGFKKPEL